MIFIISCLAYELRIDLFTIQPTEEPTAENNLLI